MFLQGIRPVIAGNSKTDSVIKLLRTATDEVQKAEYYNTLSQHHFKNNPFVSIQYADSAEKLALKLKASFQLANAYYWKGCAYLSESEFSKSFGYFLKAIPIYEKSNNKKELSAIYNNMGTVLMNQKSYSKALVYFEKSVSIKKNLNDSVSLAIPVNNIGSVYDEMGDYKKAIQYYTKSLVLCKAFGDKKGIATANQNIGIALTNMQDYENARNYFFDALKLEEQLKNPGGITLSLNNIASLYNITGQESEAVPLLIKCIAIAKESSLVMQQMDAWETLSESYEKLGNKDKAIESLKNHLELKDKLFKIENARQINELQIKYETAQKENQLYLLKQEAELNELKFRDQRLWLTAFIFALLLVATITLFFLYRTRSSKKMAGVQHQKKEAEAKQRISELQLSALRAQMNPHFIFNCINSIQFLVKNNKLDDAESYLDKFAQLLRLVLDSSHSLHITLADEIKTLKLYMDLESLRFRENFSYRIHVDPQLEPENIEISTMLIQPYVENAVKHGFTGARIKGLIQINFLLVNDKLCVIIEDNGIGRKKSMELKTSASHKFSLGMKVTRERIDLMNTGEDLDASVFISDLENETGQSAGTKVQLTLPLD